MVDRLNLGFRYLVLVVLTGLLAGCLAGFFWMVYLTPHFFDIVDGIGVGTNESNSLGVYTRKGAIRQVGGTAVRWTDQLSPAEQAGIAVGDTIIAVDGVSLRDKPEVFYRTYLRAGPGTEIAFTVRRGSVTETRRLVVKDPAELRRTKGWLGVSMTWLTPELAKQIGAPLSRGALIRGVSQGLAADQVGLKPQDIVLSANGSEVSDLNSFSRLIVATPPGQVLNLRIVRGRDTLDVAPTVTEQPPPTTSFLHAGSPVVSGSRGKAVWTFYGPFLAVSLLCLAVGVVLGWARPRDPIAFQCGALFLSMGFQAVPAAPLVASWPDSILVLLAVAIDASTLLLMLLTLRVFAVFPEQSRLGRILLRGQWPFLAFLALWSGYEAVDTLSGVFGWTLGGVIPKYISAFFGALSEANVSILIVGAIIASLVIAQRIEGRRRARPRLKMLELSLGIGVAALFLFGAGEAIFRIAPESWQPARGFITYYLPVVLFAAFPIGFAYTILARKVFGIEFIIRRGIQHLLLSRGVVVVEGLLLFVILEEALRRNQPSIGNSAPAVAGLAAVASVFAVTGLTKVNRPFMHRIDRRFFRERYDARTVLLGMGQKMSALRVRSEILEQAGQAILTTLHPSRLAFALTEPGPGAAAVAWSRTLSADRAHGASEATGEPTASGVGADDTQRVADFLEGLSDGRPWLDTPPDAGEIRAEQAENGARTFELAVAVPGSQGVIGCIALAGKLSEEPFGGEDKELLATVATQMGLALENAALLEVAKREAEQAKELGIARQVQQNLFPNELPTPEGWDLAATCRPAREVGGDYYDVFRVDQDHIALALGDVSGKGIGPALVMSNVQAMIRAELRHPRADLGEVLRDVNQQLCASTSAEMFITLFLAVLDLQTGEVRYVNGGHNPPFVVAPGDETPVRLTEAGPIVGIIPGMAYGESRFILAPGGTLAIYSDGVTEAINQEQEMFGEDGLITELARPATQNAIGTMRQVLAAVDRFAAGAEQADDISVVIVKRAPLCPGGAIPV